MFKHLIEQHAGNLATLSLVLFFAAFAGVLWYVLTDRRKDHRREMCAMALEDDEREEVLHG